MLYIHTSGVLDFGEKYKTNKNIMIQKNIKRMFLSAQQNVDSDLKIEL